MKKINFLALCAMVAMMFVSCAQKVGEPQPKEITSAQVDSVSYAIGQFFGFQIAMTDFGELNFGDIAKGMKEVMSMSKDELTENADKIQQDAYTVIDNFMTVRMEAIAKENAQKGIDFLEKNKSAEGVVETASGLQYKIERKGNGVFPTDSSVVTVNYEGTLLDGTVFDSSYKRDEPVTFGLQQVISGWAEGLTYIDEGGEITLWIPSELAYGHQGAGGVIGPDEVLKFKVELISIEPLEETEE